MYKVSWLIRSIGDFKLSHPLKHERRFETSKECAEFISTCRMFDKMVGDTVEYCVTEEPKIQPKGRTLTEIIFRKEIKK